MHRAILVAASLLFPCESFADYYINSFANIKYAGIRPLPPTVEDSHYFVNEIPTVNNVLAIANSRVDTASTSIRALAEASAKSEYGILTASYGASTLCFSQCLGGFAGFGGASSGFGQSFSLATPSTDGYATFITELTGTFTGTFPRLDAAMRITNDSKKTETAYARAGIDLQGNVSAFTSGTGISEIDDASYGKFIFVNSIPLAGLSMDRFTFSLSLESYVRDTVSSAYYTLTTKMILPFGTKLAADDDLLLSKVTTYNATGLYNSAVPEPAEWATMIAGLATLGATLRRRHRETRAAKPA